jgi:hypothetical protein
MGLLKTLVHGSGDKVPHSPSFSDFSLGAADDVDNDNAQRSDAPPPSTSPQEPSALSSSPGRKSEVWRSVFNPGRNFKPMGSSYYDNVDGKGPTTWQMILKSENMRTFAALDKDEDGYISREDLSKHLGNSQDVSELIQQADKNRDGKIDYQEFLEVLRNH